MEAKCPQCSAKFVKTDINKDNFSVLCKGCKSIFGLEKVDLPQGFMDGEIGGFKKRKKVQLPMGIELNSKDGVLTIKRKWFNRGFLVVVLLAIAWNGAIVIWNESLNSTLGSSPIATIYPFIHLIIGLILFYYTLAGLVNTTIFTISKESILIKNRPIPWFGISTIASSKLKQLYSTKKNPYKNKNEKDIFHIYALLKNGKKLKIVHGLHTDNQALYIEQQIEQYLGIKDRHISNELE
jgi:hypothetical protein